MKPSITINLLGNLANNAAITPQLTTLAAKDSDKVQTDDYTNESPGLPTKGDTKKTKRVMYEKVQRPITPDDAIKRFQELYPKERYAVEGNLEEGLVVYSLDKPLHLVTVPSSQLIQSAFEYVEGSDKIVHVEFGGAAGENHIQHSTVTYGNRFNRYDIEKIVHALMNPNTNLSTVFANDRELREAGKWHQMQLSGALLVGFEHEFWAIDPLTGELANIPHEELLVGCIEIDQGHYITPANALYGMAVKQRKLEEDYPGVLLVSTSTPPSGTLDNTVTNTFKSSALGPYIAVVARNCFRRFGSRTPESLQLRTQQAEFFGFENAQQMIQALGDCRMWSTAASHMNLGVPNTRNPKTGRFEINFEIARNTSNLALSEIGAVARLFTASSPYITGMMPEIDGHNPIDTREFIRTDMGTALPQNQPIRGDEHYQEIVRSTMTQGKDGSDRLSRGIVAHTNEANNYTATAHGAGRWRLEDTGAPTGRIEYTAAPGGTMLAKARAMSVLQMLQAISLLATYEGIDVLDLIHERTGIPRKQI